MSNGAVKIGEGNLQELDWDNATIISSSKTIFYKDEKGKDIGLEVTYRAWRDFEGNIKSQFFLDKDNQPSLGIYIFKFNRYGIGTESLVVFKDGKGNWRPLKSHPIGTKKP